VSESVLLRILAPDHSTGSINLVLGSGVLRSVTQSVTGLKPGEFFRSASEETQSRELKIMFRKWFFSSARRVCETALSETVTERKSTTEEVTATTDIIKTEIIDIPF
jgi:hypothetical protein